jgi:hypothetical protein
MNFSDRSDVLEPFHDGFWSFKDQKRSGKRSRNVHTNVYNNAEERTIRSRFEAQIYVSEINSVVNRPGRAFKEIFKVDAL